MTWRAGIVSRERTGVLSATRRKIWIALLGALVGGAIAYFAAGASRAYRAEALIRVPAEDVETRVELIRRNRVLSPAARKLSFPLEELERGTEVRRKGGSNLIGITVGGVEESFSVRAANTVAEIAVNQAREELARQLEVEMEAVRSRIAQAERALLAAEQELQDFKQQNSRVLAMRTESPGPLEERRRNLSSDLGTIEAALDRLDAIAVRLRHPDSSAAPTPLVTGNPSVQTLEQKLSSDLSQWGELQAERRRLLRTRTEEAPDVKRNEQRLTQLRGEIENTLSALGDRYRSRARELENERTAIAQRLNQLTSVLPLSHTLETRQRQVDLKGATLVELQKRRQETEIRRAALDERVAVVQEARQAALEPASGLRWVLLGLLAGLVVGSLFAGLSGIMQRTEEK